MLLVDKGKDTAGVFECCFPMKACMEPLPSPLACPGVSFSTTSLID